MSDTDQNFRPFDRPVPASGSNCRWEDIDPVGAMEIGERLGIESRSVHVANRRGSMPLPDGRPVNGFDTWTWRTILWWAGETKRLRTPELIEQYEAMFDEYAPVAKSTSGNDAERTDRVPSNVEVGRDESPDVPNLPSKATR